MEIKFRGIATCDVEETRVKKGAWLFGQLVFENGRPFIVGPVVESCEEYISIESWCPVEPQTVGQFTGLNDANKVDIYEGDIVRYDHEDGPIIAQVKYQIAEDETMFLSGLALDFIRHDDYRETEEVVELQVIGNIYENPDLVSPDRHSNSETVKGDEIVNEQTASMA